MSGTYAIVAASVRHIRPMARTMRHEATGQLTIHRLASDTVVAYLKDTRSGAA